MRSTCRPIRCSRRRSSEAALSAGCGVHEAGGLVSVDLASRAPLIAAGADNGLRAVRAAAPDILFANADEVAALVGRRGARRLLEIAPIVVVKQGAAGCHVVWRATGGVATMGNVLEIAVATRPLAVTDTTGAGDAFDAGFLYRSDRQRFRTRRGGAERGRRPPRSGRRPSCRDAAADRAQAGARRCERRERYAPLLVAPRIRAALAAQRPVVALESTLITPWLRAAAQPGSGTARGGRRSRGWCRAGDDRRP